MANKQPKLQFLVSGGKKRLETPRVRKQVTLSQDASDGLERVGRSYGLLRDDRGDISQLLELIGKGNLIVVSRPPSLSS